MTKKNHCPECGSDDTEIIDELDSLPEDGEDMPGSAVEDFELDDDLGGIVDLDDDDEDEEDEEIPDFEEDLDDLYEEPDEEEPDDSDEPVKTLH
ncbi:MAG: hypothetical protein PHQ23_03000 [Candidatus Wallbacteria bacterium]|nr:hypothetical protein [Candidatus Wallbacteria bacterium]